MVDLAPDILRQRLVIEGTCSNKIDDLQIKDYLAKLSKVLDMRDLIKPVTHQSPTYGWAGWIHWETSGAHFYAWDEPFVFFSVDIYTCKAFSADEAVEFTKDYFRCDKVEFKEF